MTFLKLIRWKNLLLLFLTFFLFKFILFRNYNIQSTHSILFFYLLSLSIILIAAGGYIINDIFDIKTDKINKPQKVIVSASISKIQAILYYLFLSLSGVSLGIFISFKMGISILSVLFVSVATLLYLYAAFFKRIAIVGNLIVSLTIALSILIIGLFEFIPSFGKGEIYKQPIVLNFVFAYSLFAFGINFIREILKDIEDVDGDFKCNMKTLPILIGRKRSNRIVVLLTTIFMIAILYILIVYNGLSDYLLLYGVTLIIFPLFYFLFKLYRAKKKIEYQKLSSFLKIIMALGILSILIL